MEEIVRESDHTITLKNGKMIRISDLAIKKQSALKKPSSRKRDQQVKFYATKRLRKITKPQRNVGFNVQGRPKRKETFRQNSKS